MPVSHITHHALRITKLITNHLLKGNNLIQILENLSPVFLVIGLGYLSRKLGFLPDNFIQSANRLVYYIAIPLLVFSEISRGKFSESFDMRQLAGTLLAVGLVMLLAIAVAFIMKLPRKTAVTFTQISYHGNLGYVGLAVIFYSLGPAGRVTASVLAGFLILMQNILSISLYTFAPSEGRRLTVKSLGKFIANPIILGTVLGLISSGSGISLPGFLDRTLVIVADMALPLALLIIGGSLRTGVSGRSVQMGISTILKLLVLPLTGLILFRLLDVSHALAVPSIILLSSPSATISYVMSAEMGGDSDLAAAAVTISTVLSIITYAFWLSVAGHYL